LLFDEGIHPHLEYVVFSSVVSQHILLVLAQVITVRVRTGVRPTGRHHRVNPLLEMELGKVVLFLPVLVLGVRYKAADLALIPCSHKTRLLELLVGL